MPFPQNSALYKKTVFSLHDFSRPGVSECIQDREKNTPFSTSFPKTFPLFQPTVTTLPGNAATGKWIAPLRTVWYLYGKIFRKRQNHES
ncbi:MAG: hypothetical protein AB7E77_13300 [Desulfobulbus sp.]